MIQDYSAICLPYRAIICSSSRGLNQSLARGDIHLAQGETERLGFKTSTIMYLVVNKYFKCFSLKVLEHMFIES